MKLATILFGIILLFSFNTYAQHESKDTIQESESHHCLFVKNSVTIGVGLPYSYGLNGFGVNTRIYYNVGEHICFGPEFSILKKKDESLYDLNIVGHYIFETPLVGISPIVGANYTKEIDAHGSEETFGGIIGLGVHRTFRLITIFLEYTHVESKLRDDFLTSGLMITIK